MDKVNHSNDNILHSYRTVYPPGTSIAGTNALWSIGLTLAGRNENTIPGGSFSQEPGDFVVLKPPIYHAWRIPKNSAPWEVLFFMLVPPASWLSLLPAPETLPGLFKYSLKDSNIRDRVKDALLAAHRALHGRWTNRYALGMNALEGALLWLRAARADRKQRADPRILRATGHILENLFEPIRLDRLTRIAALSPSRFLELFRQETGATPRIYWERERLRHAENLLRHTDKPVKEITILLGYKYAPHFVRRFKDYAGVTPTSFRERARVSALLPRTRENKAAGSACLSTNSVDLVASAAPMTASNLRMPTLSTALKKDSIQRRH